MIDELLKAGDDILNSVSRAVDDGNYSRLGDELRDTISNTVENVLSGVTGVSANENGAGAIKARRTKSPERPPYFARVVDKNLGQGKVVLGVIGAVVCTGMGLGWLFTSIPMAIFFGVLDIPFLITLRSGLQSRKLVGEFYRYGNIVKGRSYIALQELADMAGETKGKVLSNIKKMKRRDFLPMATIDHEETTLMLTDEVYKEYTRSYLVRQNEEIKKRQAGDYKRKPIHGKDAEQESHNPSVKSTVSKDLRTYLTIEEDLSEDVKSILTEGNTYLNKIRDYNDMVPDTEKFSDQLYTLEATVLSIFKHVKEDPETAGELRRFMNYYLPTTEKLLQSYVDLYRQNGNIENVKNSKAEIEDALDVINEAFEKMLNQLYQDKSWDISSDISVMKTMMKQDALI